MTGGAVGSSGGAVVVAVVTQRDGVTDREAQRAAARTGAARMVAETPAGGGTLPASPLTRSYVVTSLSGFPIFFCVCALRAYLCVLVHSLTALRASRFNRQKQ